MNRNRLWIPLLGLAAALALPGVSAAASRTLGVEVWTDRGDDAVYRPGESMQVKMRASEDAYVLVYEIDSDGQVSVLYPWRRGSNLIEGKRTYRLPPEDSRYELTVEKQTGQGFIVAVASREPFRDLPWYLRPLDPQAASLGYDDHHDDEDGIDSDGRIVGDPYVAMERIRRRVLDKPNDDDGFATSYASYYVNHEVRYPRYLCYDCHRPHQYAFWDGFDPYYANCSVFDFRVNWGWQWGPRCWAGNVPYYYYVVRSDCPPTYYNWYENRTRFSSWDGYQRFNNLWGGSLIRYKPAQPPVGYVPPPRTGYDPNNPPPGFLYSRAEKGGMRLPTPIGRNGQPRGGDGQPGATRAPRTFDGNDPQGRLPVGRAPIGEGGDRGSWRDKPKADPVPGSRTPREEGGNAPPAPRFEPPRREPADRPAPRNEQPRREPAQREPRNDQPRFQPPRQERPAPPPQAPAPARREPEHREKGDEHHRG